VSEVRRDIAEAAVRMAVTFGTRSAMRDLAEELAPGETVVELAACTYAGAAGLIALTSQRVVAIRDDYSKHQVQFVVIGEVVTVDYDPTVHDGFALFTPSSRLVVRKMRREDGDRLVDALLTRAPQITLQVTRPAGAPVAQQGPQLGGQLGRLGRHRKPEPAAGQVHSPRRAEGGTAVGPAVSAQAGAAAGAVQAAGQMSPARPGSVPAAAPVASSAAMPAATMPAPAMPSGNSPAVGAASASHSAAAGARPATDKEILLGVLADLHAQGVLSADEFAAKVRQIVTQP